jgi:hypothetical protein
VAGPFSDVGMPQFSDEQVSMCDQLSFGALPFVATSALGSGASFYSSFGGTLPWIVNKIPPQRYYCVKVR